MQRRKNRRGHNEEIFEGHLQLNDLRKEAQARQLTNKYLFKENIPAYPRPEFHVSHLKHDTDQDGLKGISSDGGFKDPGSKSPKLLWWSLVVGPDDITAAETRLLEKTFPDRTQEQAERQQSFLESFATSPVFKETSMLGSYRFTFPLEEVLKAYSEQFCSGAQPVMRVFETVLYKQEVMYAVLVHSSANQKQFSKYPLLTDDPNAVCAYKDGHFIWRAEAMCKTHGYELIQRSDENQMEVSRMRTHEFYVWDNVAIALHVDGEQVLEFDSVQLRENLTFCEAGGGGIKHSSTFDTFPQANCVVKNLWPNYPGSLEKLRRHSLAASRVAEPDSSD